LSRGRKKKPGSEERLSRIPVVGFKRFRLMSKMDENSLAGRAGKEKMHKIANGGSTPVVRTAGKTKTERKAGALHTCFEFLGGALREGV